MKIIIYIQLGKYWGGGSSHSPPPKKNRPPGSPAEIKTFILSAPSVLAFLDSPLYSEVIKQFSSIRYYQLDVFGPGSNFS